MEEHKKKILTLVGVILIFIALIVVILSIIFKDEKINEPNKPSSNPNKVIAKEIEELKDEKLFFTLQNNINHYYEMIIGEETDNLINLLNPNYLTMNNINKSNLYSKLPNNLKSTSFVVKKVFYNPNSSVSYYFINGYFTNVSILDDDDFREYLPSVNYLIIVDDSNHYDLTPLSNEIDLENFARNYNIEYKKVKSNKILSVNPTSEKNKLSIYINEFLNLMFYDNERAYNMLDDNTKKKFDSRDDFENQILDIYNKLSTTIFGFSSKEANGEKVYSIIDNNQNKITIYEKNIMNYKIGF